MAAGVAFVLGLIALVFLHPATAQTVHIVGDNTGWGVPPNPTFYSDWAARRTFRLGDSLQFNFPTNAHDVLEMKTKESFDACNFTNSDNDIERTAPVIERLDELGMHYFVCTIGTHCSNGQKLSINVVAATAGGPMSPSSPSSPSPPSSVMPPPSPSSSNALMATLHLTFSALLIMTFF